MAGNVNPGHVNGVGTAASFRRPSGVAVSADNSVLYVADQGNSVIRKIDILQALVTTIAGGGSGAFADGVGAFAAFKAAWDLVVAPGGNTLYVADTSNNRVRVVVSSPAACNAGFYCPSGSSASLGSGTACLAGTYCETNTSSPVACRAGRYCLAGCSSSGGSGTCQPGYFCAAGSSSPNATMCAAGSHCPAGSSSSLGAGLCAAGSYCAAGSSSATQAVCSVRALLCYQIFSSLTFHH